MSFGGLILTNSGRNKLAGAVSENTALNFTHVKLGDGTYNGSFSSKTELTSEVMEIPITNVSRKNDKVVIDCDWNSRDAPTGFYLREIGIIGNGVLCYYDNAGFGDAEYIDPESEVISKQKRLRFTLIISSEVNVTAHISSELYALAEDVNEQIDGIRHSIDDKVDKEDGKGLSTEDYTTEEKNKVSNIQADIDEAYANANQFTLNKIAELINGAPETLDTLKEIADAVTENESVADALDAAIGKKANQTELDTHTGNSIIHITASERSKWNGVDSKVDKVSGKSLSTNDYTDAEKNKLAGIAAGANKYTLPTASGSVLGGIKINENDFSVLNGVLNLKNKHSLFTVQSTTDSVTENVNIGYSNGILNVIYCDCIATATTNWTTVFEVLESQYCPSMLVYGFCVMHASGDSYDLGVNMRIDTNGNIQIYARQSIVGRHLNFLFVYPTK